MHRLIPISTSVAIALAATAAMAQQHQHDGKSGGAVATLAAADGAARGKAMLSDTAKGLMVHVMAEGLPAGVHGLHLHMVGKCDGPDFASAGAHWNPAGKKHGHDNPEGAHSGDLPNITIGANGKGMAHAIVAGATLADLMDADGAALVIHAGPDDYKTDPSGNSGGRIACGVVTGN